MDFRKVATTHDGKYRLDFTPIGLKFTGHPQDVQNTHISLGLACNFSCGHCPVNERDKIVGKYGERSAQLGVDLGNPVRFTEPDLVGASLELFPNVEQIAFGCGGGEPTLHPQYEKILQMSRDFFSGKADREGVQAEEQHLWWTRPYDYGIKHGKITQVDAGGRIILFTNASRMPQEEVKLKEYLLEHPNITFQVSYDGFHEDSYRQHGLDFRQMTGNLGRLAGDRDVKRAGVQVYLFHVGKEKLEKLEKSFPDCIVGVGYQINFGQNHIPGTIQYNPYAMRGKKGHFESHAIIDSQGNLFADMNDIYCANFDFLCGRIARLGGS
jgi:hypothetical protein